MKKTITIAESWDGEQIRVTFRRCFDQRLLYQWFEILQIAQSLHLSDEDDCLLWKLDSKNIYSVKSWYAVVNFRGVIPVDITSVWGIKIPPKIQFFLGPVTHNKLLTRDNLVKRQNLSDLTCLFCSEEESINHLFFECVVAKEIWSSVQFLTEVDISPICLSNITKLWPDKKFSVENVVHASVLWAIWLVRNNSFFNHVVWLGLQVVWRKSAFNLAQWNILFTGSEKEKMMTMANAMEHLARAPPLLSWDPG